MGRKKRMKVKKSIAVTLSLVLGFTITLFVTMLLFNVTDYGITIASFGASIFMIFSQKNLTKRKILGAYSLATLIGYIASKIFLSQSFSVALAAVISVILMTVLELQHPPAIGMSVAMVLNKFSFLTDIIVLICLVFILTMVYLLKTFLKDPQKVINFVEIEEEKIKWNLRKKESPKYINL